MAKEYKVIHLSLCWTDKGASLWIERKLNEHAPEGWVFEALGDMQLIGCTLAHRLILSRDT